MKNKNSIPMEAIIIGSVKVGFVAVLETLISARIADNMTGTRFNQSKELFGMSLGNMLSGLFGGTPCTGVLVRTGVNVS
jgi:SulP family sulfate permease